LVRARDRRYVPLKGGGTIDLDALSLRRGIADVVNPVDASCVGQRSQLDEGHSRQDVA
jgi:hypothetical protein